MDNLIDRQTDRRNIKYALKEKYKDLRFAARDLLINRPNRKRLINHSFSIIGSDCTAACICKDLKMRMNSPTRNFYFNAGDYIKFCQNLRYYLTLPLTDDPENGKQPYQTAMCGDLRLFLVHYNSVQQAKDAWERRKGRVNFDNIFFLMNDRNGCTEEDIKAFDQLPYKNKVCFTYVIYPQYKSTCFIPGSEDGECIQSMMNYIHQWWIKRYYDDFDYVSWLNNVK